MNQWAIDKLNESMTNLIESNNAQLAVSSMTTDAERQELDKHYSAISKILLTATQRHVKKSWEKENQPEL